MKMIYQSIISVTQMLLTKQHGRVCACVCVPDAVHYFRQAPNHEKEKSNMLLE